MLACIHAWQLRMRSYAFDFDTYHAFDSNSMIEHVVYQQKYTNKKHKENNYNSS